MSLSLYVHIPFCKKKCNYCDFPSYAGKEDLIPDYLEALRAESGYLASLYDHPKIGTLFIGGGTPTLLSPENISILFDALLKDFELSHGAEITIEANPGTISTEKLMRFKKYGVNRLSLGAQTFNNALLKRLGRIHLAHEISDAFHMARDAGFKNINLDLIFALPGENKQDWDATLKEAIALGPEHISTYNLQIEEGTPLHGEKLEGSLLLPEEEMELDMFKCAIDALTKNGYVHYEISNFAKPGLECRHNLTYWTLKDYIGIGAGAHSYIDGSRFENTPDLDIYLSKDLARIKKGHKNSKKENMQEFIFLGLRVIDGISLELFTTKFGFSFRELYKKEIDELTNNGLLEISGKKVKLTRKGLYLANEVFKAFI